MCAGGTIISTCQNNMKNNLHEKVSSTRLTKIDDFIKDNAKWTSKLNAPQVALKIIYVEVHKIYSLYVSK